MFEPITCDTHRVEPDCSVAETGRRPIGANAYLGADAIAPALQAGADLIITGRVADPALFLAPIAHHFDWATTTGQYSVRARWLVI
ncbi:MAG: hypothetical protein Ct9H300mP16_00210 [Pseudomonadota bacterium]|nr:MAG: hypothetical protein Ct9H300mP16_00210 [Pseudomonadota bacterium]